MSDDQDLLAVLTDILVETFGVAEDEVSADATFEDIRELVVGVKGRSLLETGDMEAGVWSAGTVMGIIRDIPTVKELVDRIVREAEEIINQRLRRIAN